MGDGAALQPAIGKLHQGIAVGANDHVTADRVKSVIAVQVALLERSLGVEFDAGIAVDLGRRRGGTDSYRQSQEQARRDDAGPTAQATTLQWSALQRDPPSHLPVIRRAA